MKNLRLLAIIATCLLVTSVFVVIPAFSVQPPLDSSTYYVGTIGQPVDLDPTRAYDTASGEIIQNVYQTLIWYGNKTPVVFTPGVGHNMTLSEYADLTVYKPVLATEVPTVANGRIVSDGGSGSYWTFTVNTNAVFQPWVAANGSLVPARNLTVDDVVWSFQRQMVVEMSSSPAWMFFMPAFGIMGFRYAYSALHLKSASNGTFVTASNSWPNVPNETFVQAMIQGWCYASGGNNVTFHWGSNWATNVLYEILSQTWGSVVNKDWAIEHGDWDGLWTAGWSNYYRRKPEIRFSALDKWKSPAIYGAAHASKYPSSNPDVPGMCGTGPYNFTATNWDQTTKTWRIDRFVDYWGGWGANAGNGAGNYISTVIEKGIDAYPTRKMLFLNGEFDVAVIPRANMYDLLTGDAYTPIAGINLAYNIASLSNDVLLFQLNQTASTYPAYVGGPGNHKTGAITDLFANDHIRKAFAWALNYTSYVHDAWFDEAIIQRSWWVDGLNPADYKNTNASMPQRNLDYNQMKNELDQAIVDGFNVSDVGFEATLAYNIGNDQRLIACQLIQSAFLALGSKYKVNIVALDWPVFLAAEQAGELPAYDVGWLADFADPDNFARPYQHSAGDFASVQGPPYPADQTFVDNEIDAAIVEQNNTLRKADYQDLQFRYWNDCISFPLIQPVGRRFARDWVQGWYFNPLFPGLYAYDLYKAYPTPLQPVTLDLTHTITTLVGFKGGDYATTGPFSIYWHKGEMWMGYNSSAPYPQSTINANKTAVFTFSIFVKRTDANGNVSILTAAVSLERFNGTYPTYPGFAYPNSTLVTLAAGGNQTVLLDWTEDGTYPELFAPWNPVVGVVGNSTTLWNLAALGAPLNATQTIPDLGLLMVNDSNVLAKVILGDFKQYGVISILDDIVMGNVYGQTQAGAGTAWGNPIPGISPTVLMSDCDLKPDGQISILDYIVLGSYFGQTAP